MDTYVPFVRVCAHVFFEDAMVNPTNQGNIHSVFEACPRLVFGVRGKPDVEADPGISL